MSLVAAELRLDDNEVLRIASPQAAEGYWSSTYGTLVGQAFLGTCVPKDMAGLLGFSQVLGIDMPLLRKVAEVISRTGEPADIGRIAHTTAGTPDHVPQEVAAATGRADDIQPEQHS